MQKELEEFENYIIGFENMNSSFSNMIQQSWQRSRKNHIDPNQKQGKVYQDRWRQSVKENAELIETSLPLMKDLYKLVEGTGFVVVICDQSGLLLKMLGDEETLIQARRIAFIEGADWSEQAVGTNAIGTCIYEGVPLQVFYNQHYCKICQKWTCSASSIFGPYGELIGVLNMSGPYEKVHPHTLGMVVSAAKTVESLLKLQEKARRNELMKSYLETTVNALSSGILLLSQQGEIIQANKTFQDMMDFKEEDAEISGLITKIHKKRGEVLAAGDDLVSIKEASEEVTYPMEAEAMKDSSQTVPPDSQGSAPSFVKVSPRVRKMAKDLGVDLATVKGTGRNGEPTVEDVQKVAKETQAKETQDKPTSRIIASPSVRKLAREKGVNLEDLQLNGRIEREDVLKLAAEKEQTAMVKEGAKSTAAIDCQGEIERVKLVGIRKATAKAMSFSKQTIPHVTHFAEADVTALVHHRERFKELAQTKLIKLTFLPYVVKALISTLKEFKELNTSLDESDEAILYKKFYNIGIAVQTDSGLVVPVVKNADQKKIGDLAKEIDVLTKTARENKLTLEQMKGGTCTISNIGSAGGQWFTPVINHPETSILGIGEIFEKPIVRNGEIVIGKMLPLSLSYDHRVIDGVLAQNALNHLKKLLQDPELLLLDL